VHLCIHNLNRPTAHNDNGGYYNASNFPNSSAFATLRTDGSIMAWGDSSYGGTAPAGNGYTKTGAFDPPLFESPHAVIDPSALRAAKANAFE
jgi:hypothetical protein